MPMRCSPRQPVPDTREGTQGQPAGHTGADGQHAGRDAADAAHARSHERGAGHQLPAQVLGLQLPCGPALPAAGHARWGPNLLPPCRPLGHLCRSLPLTPLGLAAAVPRAACAPAYQGSPLCPLLQHDLQPPPPRPLPSCADMLLPPHSMARLTLACTQVRRSRTAAHTHQHSSSPAQCHTRALWCPRRSPPCPTPPADLPPPAWQGRLRGCARCRLRSGQLCPSSRCALTQPHQGCARCAWRAASPSQAAAPAAAPRLSSHVSSRRSTASSLHIGLSAWRGPSPPACQSRSCTRRTRAGSRANHR